VVTRIVNPMRCGWARDRSDSSGNKLLAIQSTNYQLSSISVEVVWLRVPKIAAAFHPCASGVPGSSGEPHDIGSITDSPKIQQSQVMVNIADVQDMTHVPCARLSRQRSVLTRGCLVEGRLSFNGRLDFWIVHSYFLHGAAAAGFLNMACPWCLALG
jgi:hypothetical protein